MVGLGLMTASTGRDEAAGFSAGPELGPAAGIEIRERERERCCIAGNLILEGYNLQIEKPD